MLSFNNIYDLAELAVTRFGLRGIDWVALAQKGRGSVWDRNYIDEYLTPAVVRMNAVVVNLDLTTDASVAEMQAAYSTTAGALNNVAQSVLPLFGVPLLNVQVTLQASREAVRKTVAMMFKSTMYAYQLHLDETIQHSDLSDAEIASHANLCCGVMNAITALGNLGFFKALSIQDSTSGLGIAPLTLGVIAGIAAFAILAWAVVSLYSLNKINTQISTMCDKAQASGDQATLQQCLQTLSDSNKAAGTLPVSLVKQILDTVMPYALAGAAIYVGILFAPAIVKNIMAPRSS